MGSTKRPEEQIALHEKILKEYLERMNETTEADKSINWVTHQKCKDMFILSKVSTFSFYKFASFSLIIYVNPVIRVYKYWDKVFKVLRPK